MTTNTPVSTLSATLSLDVAGFAAGVKQAESLSRRLAKAQADALGGPALRRAGGQSVADQVIRAQELRARALASPDAQGPVRLRQANIDAEISAEMGKRVAAAQRRVEIERQTEATISSFRAQSADNAAAANLRLTQAQSLVGKSARESFQSFTPLFEAYENQIDNAAAANLRLTQAQSLVGKSARESFQSFTPLFEAYENQIDNAAAANLRLTQAQSLVGKSARESFAAMDAASDAVTAKIQARAEAQDQSVRQMAAAHREIMALVGSGSSDLPTRVNSTFNDLPSDFEKLTPKAAAAQYALRSIGNTSADSQKSLRDFNLRILQGGYQLQDFVVQVGSGTNALVAFAQQGSQFAGFFGAAGAWIGVGLAVSSLAANMLLMGNNSTKASEGAAKVVDNLKQIKELTTEIGRLRSGDSNTFDLAEAKAQQKNAQDRLSYLQESRDKAANSMDAIAPRNSRGKRPIFSEYLEIRNLVKEEADLGQQIEALKVERLQKDKEILEVETRIFEINRQNRAEVMGALNTNTKPLVDEKMMGELIKATALTKEQVVAYRTMAEIQKIRANYDILSGKTNIEQLAILNRQLAALKQYGLQHSELNDEIAKQAREVERAAKLEARGYIDQLDPLRQKRRELEDIHRLETAGLLPKGTTFQLSNLESIQRGRSERVKPFDESNVEQLRELVSLRSRLVDLGLEESALGKDITKQQGEAREAAKAEASAYRDQLDPLRQKRRELKNIRDLEAAGFLDKGTAERFQMRYQDEARRALKIPDQMQISGAMSSGGFAGNASGASLLDANKKMLSALEKIVNYTSMMAGNN